MAETAVAKPAAPDSPRLMKMKELSGATGVSKATIIYYVNEGLLPQPLKTSRNMAYYDPSCIERIGFIQQIKRKHRLPLAAIKRLLKERDQGRDIAALVELQEFVFGPGRSRRLNLAQFAEATGLSIDQVRAYLDAEILIPMEHELFDSEDVAVGKALCASLEFGLTSERAAFYPRLAKEIVEEEMEMRRKLTAELPYEEDAKATLELTRTARVLRSYQIDRVFQRRLMKTRGLKDHGKTEPKGKERS
jgi:DNA-binding transcriptional MerR regulator